MSRQERRLSAAFRHISYSSLLRQTMAANQPIDPGHSHAATKHINFQLYRQTVSSGPFGYDHFVSLPPAYDQQPYKKWPLVVFLHGAGESKQGPNESYACLRHGVPKIILCYDRLKSGESPSIDISPRGGRNPNAGRRRADRDLSSTPVPEEVCKVVAEEFVTLTPILDMSKLSPSIQQNSVPTNTLAQTKATGGTQRS
jgi:hypothetical protein